MDRFAAQNKMDMIEIGFNGDQQTAAFANQIDENLVEPVSDFILFVIISVEINNLGSPLGR